MLLCPYICNNKNEFGYCCSTACINPLYQYSYLKTVNSLDSSASVDNDLELLCSGEGCERASVCMRFFANRADLSVAQIINYYTYGSGEASEKGVFGKSWCGPSGSWAYFICKNNIK